MVRFFVVAGIFNLLLVAASLKAMKKVAKGLTND